MKNNSLLLEYHPLKAMELKMELQEWQKDFLLNPEKMQKKLELINSRKNGKTRLTMEIELYLMKQNTIDLDLGFEPMPILGDEI